MGKTFQSALPLPPSLSKTERSAECKHYAQFIDWDLPLIVCGDFNESETSSSSMFWCTNMGLSSALVEFEGMAASCIQGMRSPRFNNPRQTAYLVVAIAWWY